MNAAALAGQPLHKICLQEAAETAIPQCEKKLARLLLDFGVVNTTDDDHKQQVPTVARCLQQLTTPVVSDSRARLTTAGSDAKSNRRPY